MADSASGGRPADSNKGTIGGPQQSIASASGVLTDDQTLSERDEILANADRTGSDSDQAASDRDVMHATSFSLIAGAIFNLNHPAHTVHWHFFTMTVSNVIVILLMLVVFVLAIVLPFPRPGGHRGPT